MTTEPAKSTPPATEEKKKARSPSYPAIGLKRCVELAQKFWDLDKRQSVLAARAAINFGYSSKSSGGQLATAALKKFGLLAEEGANDARKLKLTDLAIGILNPSSPNRDDLVKVAALTPSIHAELWKLYNGELPSDGTIRDYLVFDRLFTEEAAAALISEFRDTIAFAKLAPSDTVQPSSDAEADIGTETPTTASRAPIPPAVRVIPPQPKAQPQQQPPPVAPTMNTSPTLIDFPVPLPSGIVAFFRLPPTMSAIDFNFYKGLLDAYRPGLVKDQPSVTSVPTKVGAD